MFFIFCYVLYFSCVIVFVNLLVLKLINYQDQTISLSLSIRPCEPADMKCGKEGNGVHEQLKNDWFMFRTCAHTVCVFGPWSCKGSGYQYSEFNSFSPLCFSVASYCGCPHSFLPVGESFSSSAGHSHADDASAPNKRLWQPQRQQREGSPDRPQHSPAPHLHTGGCSGRHENQSFSAHITQHQIIAQVTFCLTRVPPATCEHYVTAFIPGKH